MQPDRAPLVASGAFRLAQRAWSDPPRAGRIVHNRQLKRLQHVHSAVAAIAGVTGTAVAIAVAIARGSVSMLEIASFLIWFLAVGFGLTVGFHRYFTHKSFQTGRGGRAVLAILGSIAAQGHGVSWVSLHRMHHEFSDRDGDPHSPNLSGGVRWRRLRGLFHAYIGWTMTHEVPNSNFYARDLMADPLIMA